MAHRADEKSLARAYAVPGCTPRLPRARLQLAAAHYGAAHYGLATSRDPSADPWTRRARCYRRSRMPMVHHARCPAVDVQTLALDAPRCAACRAVDNRIAAPVRVNARELCRNKQRPSAWRRDCLVARGSDQRAHAARLIGTVGVRTTCGQKALPNTARALVVVVRREAKRPADSVRTVSIRRALVALTRVGEVSNVPHAALS
jgi:hypothetical protein